MVWDLLSDVGDYLFGDELVGPLPEGVTDRPTVGGIFDDFSLDDLAKGAGVVGQVSDLFTSSADRKRATTPQFATRDIGLQLADLDAIKGWLDSNTKSTQVPMRRLTAEEASDPIFAPKAVNNLQQYYDNLNAPAPMAMSETPASAQGGGQPKPVTIDENGQVIESGGTSDDDMYYKLLGMQALSSRPDPLYRTKVNDPYAQFAGLLQNDSVTNKFMPEYSATKDEALRTIGKVHEAKMNPLYGNQFSGMMNLQRDNPELWEDYATLGKALNYDPTGNWVDVVAPLVAGAILTPMTAGIGTAITGAAGLSGTAASLGSKAISTGLKQAVGSVR